jgi:hypothetical protein
MDESIEMAPGDENTEEDQKPETQQQPTTAQQQTASQQAAAPPATVQQPAQQTKRNKKQPDHPCLVCGKNVTTGAVQCTLCTLWCHKACTGLSAEAFRGLEVQAKEIGLAYWAYRSCLAFANKVNRQLQAASKRQDEVEEKVEQNIRETQHNKQEIEQLKDKLRRVRSAAEAEKEERSDALAEELRERKMRRNNIIIHGLREPEHMHQARDKMENDRQTCGEIFNIIGARVRAADLRFCRRIGERGRDPRPLVIGMRSEEEKRTVLDRAGALRGSRLDNISVGPDLTKMQRRAEEKLTREAESRNNQLTTEDREKNLKWLVVGR